MLPIVDLFTSIQGEGMFTGKPSIFIRVSGCNLRCVFKNSICDTAYSSFYPEKSKYTVDAVVEYCTVTHPDIQHIVITGGEPLLYRDEIQNLITRICPSDMFKYVTIETNGTLYGFDNNWVDEAESFSILYSISPKLKTSVAQNYDIVPKELVEKHDKTRINIDALRHLVESSCWFQLKFVYSGRECIQEIEEIRNKISECSKDMPISFLNDNIMLMPEGQTVEQIQQTSPEAVEVCIEKGWTLTHRVHILIWGDKRCK